MKIFVSTLLTFNTITMVLDILSIVAVQAVGCLTLQSYGQFICVMLQDAASGFIFIQNA